MSDPREPSADEPEVLMTEPPEVVDPDEDTVDLDESIEHPAKVMRVGTMMKQLLEEVRGATLDEASRDRLKEIYETSVSELGSALSDDLRDELGRLALPFSEDDAPSSAELQIAQAQLVGWLEGLIQGIQAMLFAQQMAAQQQFQSMRRGQLPPGSGPGGPPGSQGPSGPVGPAGAESRPGTYL